MFKCFHAFSPNYKIAWILSQERIQIQIREKESHSEVNTEYFGVHPPNFLKSLFMSGYKAINSN